MSDDKRMEIDGEVARRLITGLGDLKEALEKAQGASDKLEESAKKQPSTWERAEASFQKFLGRAKEFWESSSRFGEAYRNIKEPVADIAEGLLEAAERTAQLAAEQGRLDRTQADLGVSFRQTQEYAGGFARETDLATAAVTLQTQGIRIHQRELDALSRIAMHRAIATGKEFSEIMENATETVTEGGEELGKLAPELLRVADGSHSAGDRLAAMVQVAERLGPATRDAASEFERYTATVQSSQRLIAAGFVEELTRLDQLAGKTRDNRDAAEEWDRSMRAVGQTFAVITSAALNGVGAIAGTVATAIATIPALLQGTGNAFREFTNADNLRRGVAGDRAGAAFRAALNNETLTSLTDFVEQRVNALNALADGVTNDRTEASPETPRGPDAATRARDRRVRGTSNDALQGGDANTDDGADRGKKFGARERLAASDADYERRMRATGERIAPQLAAATEAQSSGDAAKREQDRARAEEADRLKERRDQREAETREAERQTSLLVGLFERQRNALQLLRDAGVNAYNSLTQASAEWFVALALGEEGATEAFTRTLAQKSKQIAVENALLALQSTAEGLYYAFTAPPIAATKFTAAAKFAAVAVAAGGAAAAIGTPSTSGGGGGTSQRAAPLPSNRDQDQVSARAGGGNTYNFNFGGSVIGTPRDLAARFAGIMNDPTNNFELNGRRVRS